MHLDPFTCHAAEIENQIEYTEIESSLISKGLLTKEQQQMLSSPTTTTCKKQRFLHDILLCYNIENCKKFLECLKGNGQYANYTRNFHTHLVSNHT